MTKAFGKILIGLCGAALLLGAAACSGRKMSNMTPTGDTVESFVEESPAPTDSL